MNRVAADDAPPLLRERVETVNVAAELLLVVAVLATVALHEDLVEEVHGVAEGQELTEAIDEPHVHSRLRQAAARDDEAEPGFSRGIGAWSHEGDGLAQPALAPHSDDGCDRQVRYRDGPSPIGRDEVTGDTSPPPSTGAHARADVDVRPDEAASRKRQPVEDGGRDVAEQRVARDPDPVLVPRRRRAGARRQQ